MQKIILKKEKRIKKIILVEKHKIKDIIAFQYNDKKIIIDLNKLTKYLQTGVYISKTAFNLIYKELLKKIKKY